MANITTTASFGHPNYTNRDYQSIRQHLIDTIPSVVPEWTDHNESDLGIFILSSVAYAADVLDFYLNRSAEQTNIVTVDQWENAVNLLKLLDYSPYPGGAAEVMETFTFEAVHPEFTVPRGYGITLNEGPTAGLVFRVTDDTVIGENIVEASILVRNAQVIPNMILGTSNGSIYQKYYIRQTKSVWGTLKVFATFPNGNKTEWFEVDSLVGQSPTARVFKPYYDHEGKVMIVFGDGVEGRVPPRDAIISAEVWYGGGEAGNRVGANKLIRPVSSLAYVSSVTNALAPSGGAEPKTMEQLKALGPNTVKSLWSAKSLSDIETLVGNYPGVREACSLDFDSEVSDTTLKPNYRWEVNTYVLPESGIRPTSIFLSAIRSYITERKITGVKHNILPPIFYTFNLRLTVRIFENYLRQRNVIHNNIIGALNDYFDDLVIGRRVNASDITSLIDALEGVDSVTIDNVDVVKEADLDTSSNAVVSSSSFDFYELDYGEKAIASNGDGNFGITYETVSVL